MRSRLAIVAALFPVFAVAGEKASSEILILSPSDGATVPLVRAEHKDWMSLSREERRKRLADLKGFRKYMGAVGTRPLGVRLEWRCEHGAGKGCCGTYAVEVMKRRDGSVHYAAEGLKTNAVELVNLEAGEEYTCAVWCGKKIQGVRFFTEDVAPRWLVWDGVGNVRDLGAWKTRDGFRVRQGVAYRSAGLNENALTFLSARETHELHKAGQLEAQFGEKGREIAALIDSGACELDDGRLRKTFPRKEFRKGRLRGAPESREWVRRFFGIRTDIDLRRTESECWGMTESPLGPEVAWLNYPGHAYGGMGDDEGRVAFAKTFRVFLDPNRYGIVFHCIGGADRTGSVAFILNALLGVDEEDLWRDWELTAFQGQGAYFTHEKCLCKLLDVFDAYPGRTVNERVEGYVKSLGFADQDISRLRELLLDKGGTPVDFRALPKWHVVRGVENFRDMGGWTGLGGRSVRTGLLFRSARLEKIDAEGRRYVRDVLGIRTDLDLRRPDQVRKLHGRSPLGEQVLFVNRSSTAYSGFGEKDGKKYFAETFRWFLKEARYPVVFHCIHGADRTGSWAFLLNGLLGVSEEDLRKDWELTHYANGNPLFKHRTRYNSLLRTMNGYDGATLSEKIASYARSCGVTDDEIREWREKMLEGADDRN